MKSSIVQGAIVITAHHIIEGETVLETACRDYDHYKTLPAVVSYEGTVCGLTGWNSDRGYACYKSGAKVAYLKLVHFVVR